MTLIVLVLGIISTILAAASLSYISMATMVGPWIAPAIVLASSIVLKLRKRKDSESNKIKNLAIIQTIGSVGGIVGVGIGFSLPTLYFLDKQLFDNLINNPISFFVFIFFLCIAAGGFGIWLAHLFADKLLVKEKLSFPVSKLIYEIITSQSHGKQAKQLFWGFSSSWIICFFRDGFLRFKGFLPKNFYLFPSLFGKEFAIATMPMLLAIGYISGMSIVLPLFVGLLSKYLILLPLNNHSLYLPFKFFDVFNFEDFVTAFASGLVVSEFLLGLTGLPKLIWSKIKNFNLDFNLIKNKNLKNNFKYFLDIELIITLFLSFAFLTYFKFSFFSQILLLIFVVLATYQLVYIGGKIGLVTFGRFATFVMLPMMLIFKLDYLQITLLVVFFNVCAAVASDLLFDYKVGQLSGIEFKKIKKYQWIGLFFTAISIGLFLWLLFSTFQIGSPELFAQRGKSRALLIQSLNFDIKILLLGFIYGLILKRFKISPTMVFGGILMPNNLVIGLLIGAVFSYFTKNKESKYSLWSGVFAGESIWILISILLRFF